MSKKKILFDSKNIVLENVLLKEIITEIVLLYWRRLEWKYFRASKQEKLANI